MNELRTALEDHWPPNGVRVECKKCNKELYNTKKKPPKYHFSDYVASEIEMVAAMHESQSRHRHIHIEIIPPPSPVREIDCTITVNEQP